MPVNNLKNRNVRVADHRTSMRFEPALWEALEIIAKRHGSSVNAIVTEVAENRPDNQGRTSSVREFIVRTLMNWSGL